MGQGGDGEAAASILHVWDGVQFGEGSRMKLELAIIGFDCVGHSGNKRVR